MTGSVELVGTLRRVIMKPSDTAFHEAIRGSDSLPTLVQMVLSNTSGADVAATLRVNDGTTDWDVWSRVQTNNFASIYDFMIPLLPTDILYIKSATGSAITFLLNVVEYGSRFRGSPR